MDRIKHVRQKRLRSNKGTRRCKDLATYGEETVEGLQKEPSTAFITFPSLSGAV